MCSPPLVSGHQACARSSDNLIGFARNRGAAEHRNDRGKSMLQLSLFLLFFGAGVFATGLFSYWSFTDEVFWPFTAIPNCEGNKSTSESTEPTSSTTFFTHNSASTTSLERYNSTTVSVEPSSSMIASFEPTNSTTASTEPRQSTTISIEPTSFLAESLVPTNSTSVSLESTNSTSTIVSSKAVNSAIVSTERSDSMSVFIDPRNFTTASTKPVDITAVSIKSTGPTPSTKPPISIAVSMEQNIFKTVSTKPTKPTTPSTEPADSKAVSTEQRKSAAVSALELTVSATVSTETTDFTIVSPPQDYDDTSRPLAVFLLTTACLLWMMTVFQTARAVLTTCSHCLSNIIIMAAVLSAITSLATMFIPLVWTSNCLTDFDNRTVGPLCFVSSAVIFGVLPLLFWRAHKAVYGVSVARTEFDIEDEFVGSGDVEYIPLL